jgi:hypothetical protein
MSRTKATKPKLNIINPETIQQKVLSCVNDQIVLLGYDLNNPKDRKSISHNEVNYILRRVYDNIFKPSTGLMNNQKSIIDYDDIEQIQAVVNVYIDICSRFNKSLGLMSFSFMSGIDITTLLRWINNPELNLERSKAIQKIQEVHKALQIGLLNDSPVGALAVANNDVETGLEWSKQQALTQANNTVYILSSERLQGLGLPKADSQAMEPPQ